MTDDDCIQSLLAAQRIYICSEASRCGSGLAHDAYTRLLTTLLWTDGSRSGACDCRLYEPAGGGKEQVTKNDHLLAMLSAAMTEKGMIARLY